MRLGFIARYDARDPHRGSGSFAHFIAALESAGHDVETFTTGPVEERLRERLLRRLHGSILPGRYQPSADLAYARRVGRAASRSVVAWDGNRGGDWLLTNDPLIGAFVESRRPLALFTDSHFDAIVGCGGYPRFNELSARCLRDGAAIQRRCSKRARLSFFPAQWIAEHALRDQESSPDRIVVVPWGPNLEVPAEPPPRTPPTRERCRLLFVGIDRSHKRLTVALDTLRTLREHGIDATLRIVGPRDTPPLPDGAALLPFVDKTEPEGQKTLARHYVEADVLVNPSRAESYGLVTVEGGAFGLPTVAEAHTGFLTTIQSEVSGLLLEPGTDGHGYARAVERLIDDPDLYLSMSRGARENVESVANWPAAVSRVVECLEAWNESVSGPQP